MTYQRITPFGREIAFHVQGNDAPSNAGVEYIGLSGVKFGSATTTRTIMPASGRFQHLQVYVNNAPNGATKSWTIALRVNGVDSALTVTITDTETEAIDNTHSVHVSKGDEVDYGVTPANTPVAADMSISVGFVPD